jgi:Zn-dependent protease with chaperone function
MQAPASFDTDSLRVKVEEINSFKLKKPIYRTRSESKKLLEKVINRIEPFAVEICLATRDDIKKCKWELEVVSSNQFNAYASGDNKISFYTGLVRGVYYEEELAFVVAHEIAHHIGNHLNESLISTLTGAFLGALVASESDLDIFSADIAQTGAYIGRFSGSRKRESEADFISTIILKKAGYDLEKARIGLIRMTRTGLSKTSSKFLDSHPTGPERLIAYDEITNSL